MCNGEDVVEVSCVVVFDEGFVDFMVTFYGSPNRMPLVLWYFLSLVPWPFHFVVGLCVGGAIVINGVVIEGAKDSTNLESIFQWYWHGGFG